MRSQKPAFDVLLRRVLASDIWRKGPSMLNVALTDFTRNNCHYMAAGIAYWTLFSLFPLALAGISILGFIYTTPDEQSGIVVGVVKLAPVSEEVLEELVSEVVGARGPLGGLAIVGLLWTGTAVFSAVRKGVNHAWHIGKPQYFLLERALDLVMLLGVAALAFVQIVFTTNLLGISALATSAAESGAGGLLKVLVELLGLGVTFGAFMLLYRYLPNTKVLWRDLWLGAFVGATLFHGIKVGFAWYFSSFASFNVVYGSLGAIMAVLVWAYLSAIAIVLGAQLAYTYRGVFGSEAGLVALPAPKPRREKTAQGRGIRGVAATLVSWLLPPKEDRR